MVSAFCDSFAKCKFFLGKLNAGSLMAFMEMDCLTACNRLTTNNKPGYFIVELDNQPSGW